MATTTQRPKLEKVKSTEDLKKLMEKHGLFHTTDSLPSISPESTDSQKDITSPIFTPHKRFSVSSSADGFMKSSSADDSINAKSSLGSPKPFGLRSPRDWSRHKSNRNKRSVDRKVSKSLSSTPAIVLDKTYKTTKPASGEHKPMSVLGMDKSTTQAKVKRRKKDTLRDGELMVTSAIFETPENPHKFVEKWFTRPTWCCYCGRYIFQSLSKQGHACSIPGCGYHIHSKCKAEAEFMECAAAHAKAVDSELDVFGNQVAGHKEKSSMLKDGNAILKPLSDHEFEFYEQIKKQEPQYFHLFLPKYYGCRSVINEFGEINHYIVLEDLTCSMGGPCICDLKIGFRGHDDKASTKKVLQQKALCNLTTSSTLGFRMCGMKVWRRDGADIVRDKKWGSRLRDNTMRGALIEFLNDGNGNYRFDVIPYWLEKLYKIQEWFEEQTEFNFYSSSILLLYDGSVPFVEEWTDDLKELYISDTPYSNEKEETRKKFVDVRMVDFAHVTSFPPESDALDTNYLEGLKIVIKLLKEMEENKDKYEKSFEKNTLLKRERIKLWLERDKDLNTNEGRMKKKILESFFAQTHQSSFDEFLEEQKTEEKKQFSREERERIRDLMGMHRDASSGELGLKTRRGRSMKRKASVFPRDLLDSGDLLEEDEENGRSKSLSPVRKMSWTQDTGHQISHNKSQKYATYRDPRKLKKKYLRPTSAKRGHKKSLSEGWEAMLSEALISPRSNKKEKKEKEKIKEEKDLQEKSEEAAKEKASRETEVEELRQQIKELQSENAELKKRNEELEELQQLVLNLQIENEELKKWKQFLRNSVENHK
eukprot:CAMPEP_0174259474 /NCGR_PEP_ID=MMETSP0439-20130205/8290_1 /TAXON_ID=0 /ORGANISM="Stereomyxa ramosa, Strain Chinc5" /LENGTH=818 /DNA_ID=CAMNT_0015343371 /DNA_START=37 /DNA_END=2493 /DNA_ORIENTATION=-